MWKLFGILRLMEVGNLSFKENCEESSSDVWSTFQEKKNAFWKWEKKVLHVNIMLCHIIFNNHVQYKLTD